MFRKATRFAITTIIPSLSFSGIAIASGGGGTSGPKAHWGYRGGQSPSLWGKLSTACGLCSAGHPQTPITN